MNIPGNSVGRFGLAGLILSGMAAIWWVITRYGKLFDIVSRREQILAFVLICLTLVLIRYLPALSRYVKESYHRQRSRRASVLPDEENRVALTPPHSITVGDIRQAMRYQYGRAWRRKIRILLVTGSAGDVERFIPKLTQELWQEDRGTLLLWGGDPVTPADTGWLESLRKLRRRPADGIVWVTS
ncbi:type VI secretion protein VasK, partial [Escherichia alba]|nr:type VI secretion protein VasK [Intestinirhabdus alba]